LNWICCSWVRVRKLWKVAECCELCCWFHVFWVVLVVILHIEPVNIVVFHFGWSGDQNWVFGWKKLENSWTFELPRWSFAWSEMQANTKRDTPRLTTFRSLEANHEGTLSEREPTILWRFRLKRNGLRLKRDRSCTTIFWILLRALGH